MVYKETLSTTYVATHKPDGLADLEELYKDLSTTSINDNSPFSLQTKNHLLMKVEMIIKKLQYKPRLPLYQIEKEITEICKRDKSTHGVVIKVLFFSKFGVIDDSRLSHLKVNV
ncbi:hypothetical protein ES677_14825 [Bizionia gelidisalsuginis]|uniref:Uncharacterized protein n=1 Tax=Bizionia gelidisalsuginis TaxID=291188 RepID=A0ABY3M6V2_9FLAO|nr:hypothetical protein [Bizionia gelidisalsuginis]TYC07806.1 hypothetical protein ES677_14825 [Bizionia gelidisalsuginis]